MGNMMMASNPNIADPLSHPQVPHDRFVRRPGNKSWPIKPAPTEVVTDMQSFLVMDPLFIQNKRQRGKQAHFNTGPKNSFKNVLDIPFSIPFRVSN